MTPVLWTLKRKKMSTLTSAMKLQDSQKFQKTIWRSSRSNSLLQGLVT